MRLFFAAVVWGACSFGCGSGSTSGTIPQAQACSQASTAICARVFSCSDPNLVIAQQLVLGGSEANCRTTVQQNYCAPFQCTGGSTYHGDRAQECKEQFAAVSCMTLATAAGTGSVAAVLTTVPACQQVCTGQDAGTTD